jgi:hypothetical protein
MDHPVLNWKSGERVVVRFVINCRVQGNALFQTGSWPNRRFRLDWCQAGQSAAFQHNLRFAGHSPRDAFSAFCFGSERGLCLHSKIGRYTGWARKMTSCHSGSNIVKIASVKATERFDSTEFSNQVADGMALSMYAAYTCPRCEERIGFQKRNFEDAVVQSRTNLAPDISNRFDEFAIEHLGRANHYLDWICPGCGLSVRVYLQVWAGGRHGDSGIDLAAVIEAE